MEKETLITNEIIDQVSHILKEKGYHVNILNNDKEVKEFINKNIPDECIVGLGDSITTCKLNIRHILATKGSTIFYSYDGSENYNRSLDTFEPAPKVNYYITRLNALTPGGKILMKDYSKEAAESISFPEHFYAFAGINRINEFIEDCSSLEKYTVFNDKPKGVEFTVNILPYLVY